MFSKSDVAKSLELHNKTYGFLKWSHRMEFDEFDEFITSSVEDMVDWFKRNYNHIPLSFRPKEHDILDFVNFLRSYFNTTFEVKDTEFWCGDERSFEENMNFTIKKCSLRQRKEQTKE